MNWQQIDFDTTRTKVPEGWLVKVSSPTPHMTPAGDIYVSQAHTIDSITFVPDKYHTWQVETYVAPCVTHV